MPADSFLLLGVLHLLPLPAGPVASPGLAAVTERALQDAEVLARAGFAGCVVENFGDAPFHPVEVDPHVPAMMAVVADRVRQRWGDAFKVGLNVLRNDARAALAAAADARRARLASIAAQAAGSTAAPVAKPPPPR